MSLWLLAQMVLCVAPALAAEPGEREDEARFVGLMEDLSLIFEDVGADCPVLVATLDDWIDRHGAVLEAVGPSVLERAATSVATSRRVEGILSPMVAPVTAARGTCADERARSTFTRLDAFLTPPPPPPTAPALPPKERRRLARSAGRFVALMTRLDDELEGADGDCVVLGETLGRFADKRGGTLRSLSGDYYAATLGDALPEEEQSALVLSMRAPTLRLLRAREACGGHATVTRGVRRIQSALEPPEDTPE